MNDDRGEQAQGRIAELEAEVARLQGRLADDRLGEDLRALLTGAGALAYRRIRRCR